MEQDQQEEQKEMDLDPEKGMKRGRETQGLTEPNNTARARDRSQESLPVKNCLFAHVQCWGLDGCLEIELMILTMAFKTDSRFWITDLATYMYIDGS